MLEVEGFDLEVAEDRDDFGYGDLGLGLEEVEETRDIFLEVQLYFERLEGWAYLLPHVVQTLIGNLFKLVDFVEELVHVQQALLEYRVLGIF